MEPGYNDLMETGLIDKTILITGASDGIGKQCAIQLAGLGARIFVHGRNVAKTQDACDEVIGISGNPRVETIIADLRSLHQVQALANQVRERTRRLDVLINNAGIFMNKRRLTDDGLETTFEVNYLAHFYLTNLLMDLLKDSTPSRVINVSSVGHKLVYLNLRDLQGKFFFWNWIAYCRSKLLNLMFSFELAERLKGSGVVVNAVHPGVISTNVLKNARILSNMTPEDGARSIVQLASSPELETVTGKYFDRFRPGKASPLARKVDLRKKIWDLSWQLCSTAVSSSRS